MRTLIAAALVIAAITVAGCSSDAGKDASKSPTSTPITPQPEYPASESLSPQNAGLTMVGDKLTIIESRCVDEPPLLELGGMWVNLSNDASTQRAERRPQVGTVDPTSGQDVAGYAGVQSFDLAALSEELEALKAVQPPFTDALLMVKRGTPGVWTEVSVSLTDLPIFPLVRPIPNAGESGGVWPTDSIDIRQGVAACP